MQKPRVYVETSIPSFYHELRTTPRVAQLASSCVRSIRNLRVTFNGPNGLNLGSSVHSKFLVPAAPSFCEAGPPSFFLAPYLLISQTALGYSSM